MSSSNNIPYQPGSVGHSHSLHHSPLSAASNSANYHHFHHHLLHHHHLHHHQPQHFYHNHNDHHHHHHEHQHQNQNQNLRHHVGSSDAQTRSTSPSSSAVGGGSFTREMRHRQARGRDPYGSPDDCDDRDHDGEFMPTAPPVGSTAQSTRSSKMSFGSAAKEATEPYEVVQRRERAARFLDDPELLMMMSLDTGESVTSVRLRLMTQLCGYETEPGGGHAQASSSCSPYQSHDGSTRSLASRPSSRQPGMEW